jgi:hypothetical protein
MFEANPDETITTGDRCLATERGARLIAELSAEDRQRLSPDA